MIYLAGGIASFFSANLIGKAADMYGKLKIFSLSVICALPLVIGVTNMPTLPFYFILALFAACLQPARGVV